MFRFNFFLIFSSNSLFYQIIINAPVRLSISPTKSVWLEVPEALSHCSQCFAIFINVLKFGFDFCSLSCNATILFTVVVHIKKFGQKKSFTSSKKIFFFYFEFTDILSVLCHFTFDGLNSFWHRWTCPYFLFIFCHSKTVFSLTVIILF